MHQPVVVIIGAGGCGLAAARRLASGRKLVIGSRSQKSLEATKSTLEHEGHRVETHQVDVTDSGSVHEFAKQAAAAGTLDVIVHTSGISPAQSGESADKILSVNILGTAYVIDAFLPYVGPGSSLICVSSIAAYMTWLAGAPPTPALEKHFATAPSSQLLEHDDLKKMNIVATTAAYPISKRANNLRVEGFVVAYGDKGARINTVSPAAIMTKMGHEELENGHPEGMEWMKQCGGLKRHATPDDVAAVIAFLASREASYITGTDILLDGGSRAGMLWNPIDAGGIPTNGVSESEKS
ncbi:hypothetical protein M409DRAFT_17875 [Zasmidium cellare ATCC 36951]|uniref:Short-chain dehydrogenase/reductase SDR n=1 Tax=Zasmidium cellare ATCC 36951 TaxID=1080233 RepID=A0A6A6CZQ8_ZASCE|nr:uncharacterized protein M409DRAFT_17875 [Zasmidium cellare ATCC 36951]KAF2171638.1 hypothetical protein M409DRAFT_17875 [Zasmidium cellare ATCC 36951]